MPGPLSGTITASRFFALRFACNLTGLMLVVEKLRGARVGVLVGADQEVVLVAGRARRHAEEKLRWTEESFRLMVESVTDYAIYMLDPNGNVSSWNFGAERIKGYRPDKRASEADTIDAVRAFGMLSEARERHLSVILEWR